MQPRNDVSLPSRPAKQTSTSSKDSVPPPGSSLTGKQEHCKHIFLEDLDFACRLTSTHDTDLKRELLSQQVDFEITELASTTALQRFGAPFRSEFGEVAPVDSDLPILRYIFVHHVRNFPFLDQAKEKEFWQDKLQVVGSTTLRPNSCMS